MTTKHEFNCIFCKDVFSSKEDLQDHFRKHGDPLFRNRFQTDTQVSDEKSKDKSEMVSCDVCSQVFPTISKAITHKHKVHPDHDAKYFCPWCGKLFTLKHLYNMHVQSNHSDQDVSYDRSFLCDICCVDFFNPSAMLNHNKFFHRQDTDLPDVGQSKKFKLHNQEVIPIYYCAFCGEEYENKVNLFKHMTEEHSDENQSPEEVLKCPLCEAVFYHLDAYEIHLTFHSPDDNYSVKNNVFKDLLDYSLETLPPKIEKVELLEADGQNQDNEAESTINAVGIERFLELAMDQSEDNSVKVKKHKKHKKSKKSAITLDEFLSMNQDVFGEGLDFQGIEEIPTRVVKKQLKNKKKLATNSATSMELEKLKKAGIVIKKKVGRNPVVKGMKVTSSRPLKLAQNKSYNKINPDQEIKTSSEVLTKLINQSNNQIRIVKKNNTDNVINEPRPITKDVSVEESEMSSENVSENVKESSDNIDQAKYIASPKPDRSQNENIPKDMSNSKFKEPSESSTPVKLLLNKYDENDFNSDLVKQNMRVAPNNNDNLRKTGQDLDLLNPDNNKGLSNEVDKEVNKIKSDPNNSDAELEERESGSDTDTLEKKYDPSGEIGRTSENSNNTFNNSPSVSSLSTLKHLSHLITVKPVTQNKTTTSAENTEFKVGDPKSKQPSEKGNNKETSCLSSQKVNPVKPKNVLEKDPTLDALKTLSKNITIKSLSKKRNIDNSESENDGEMDNTEKPANNLKLNDVSASQNIRTKKLKVETIENKSEFKIANSLNTQEKSHPGIPTVNKQTMGMKPKVIIENTDSSVHTSNADILKRLTNITSKPIINKQKLSPAGKQINETKKIVQTEEEIIEIFDIDDSEDENENISKKPQPIQNVMSINALKNLSKNITVKPLNQQAVIKEERQEENCSNFKDDSTIEALINMQNSNIAFKNDLQGIHKNITMKPRTDQSQDDNTRNPNVMDDYDANDSDSCSGNVKISEIDDDMCDGENNSGNFETFYTNHDNPIVDSPDDSFSDSEDIHEKECDFESEIKFSTVQKCNQNMQSMNVCLNNLKNISKNITIKSLNKNSSDKEDKTKPAQKHEPVEISQIKQLPAKSSKHIIKELQNENTNKNSKNFDQTVDHTSNQSLNQQTSTINEVNTVNKEVTVQTYQRKTVIQKITTTVTKTIKTVNQTVKQELRNTCQSNNPMITQRVQGMRPSQSKNLQGVVIRHATPHLGPKTSNTIPQIRPTNTVVRPSNQLVPVRAGINVTRPNNPRMAVGKKVTPSPSSNKQVIGKPLKISPAALASTIAKRPNTEDVSGPFSCFKKPKESLIPVSDIPTFANSGAEGTAQFTAASHSSSNYTSTTKIIKGNSVVTAKQMKSEVKATSQQLSRLCNTTGLKIKTSQAKQTQVQERSDSSAMARTTLEAIQRLQQQGLLVKKPRADEGGEGSEHDGGNNVEYSSADEPDE